MTLFIKLLVNFANSDDMYEFFSETFMKEFVKLKTAEALAYQKTVTDWEIKRYL